MTASTHLSLASLALILLVLTAAAYDVRTRRILNWLVGMGPASALVAQDMAIDVGTGCLAWLGGAAVGIDLCFGLFVLGGMGASDVKLVGAIGAFMGSFSAFHVTLVSFLADGVLAPVMVLLHWEARRSATGVSVLLLSTLFGDKAVHAEGQGPKHGGTIQLPYAVAFAAGTLLMKWGAIQSRGGTLTHTRALQEQLTTAGQARPVNNVPNTHQIPRHSRAARQRPTRGK